MGRPLPRVFWGRLGASRPRRPGSRVAIDDRQADRKPTKPLPQPKPVPDAIPWGIAYEPGVTTLPPVPTTVPADTYTLKGKKGSAEVVVTDGPSRFNPGATEVVSVAVTYTNYSADGLNSVDGTEAGTRATTPTSWTWQSDLTFSGLHNGTRKDQPRRIRGDTQGGLGGLATFRGPSRQRSAA